MSIIKTIIRWDGKRITRPGAYASIPIETYHDQICPSASVSSSGLRRLLEENKGSPAHFYSEWSGNPKRVEPEEKQHLVLGRAVHHLILGQRNFARTFAVRPDEFKDWRTAASREWRERAELGGYTAITPSDLEVVRGMSKSLGLNPMILPKHGVGLLNGHVEISFFWQDKATGIWLKARPDAIPTDSGDFADLKTTASVYWPDLVRTIGECAYHQQAALIREAARVCLGLPMSSYTLVFVEKRPPYCVRLVMLREEDLDRGYRQNHRALALMAGCLKSKSWPGPGGYDVEEAALPESLRKRIDETLNEAKAMGVAA